MATNPLNDLPPIDDDDPVVPSHASPSAKAADQETAASVAATSPQRNLLKSLTKFGVPIFAVALIAWLMFTPDKPHGASRVAPEKVEVDTKRQADDTVNLVDSLKSDANKPAKRGAVILPVMPGARQPAAGQVGATPGAAAAPVVAGAPAPAQGTYSPAGNPPLPTGYGQPLAASAPQATAATEAAQKQAADLIKRREEIRASPMEAGPVRVMEQGSATPAAKAGGPIADLQADLASVAQQKADALRTQQEMQDRALSALAPPAPPAKSKGANEDFLAGAAASSSRQGGNPLMLQAPVAAFMIGEGTAVRTVLLSRVNSGLPGRIVARVTSDVYDSQLRRVLIPKGSLINGIYNSQVVVGQERLLMAMTKLTLPNGNWISLAGASATDMMGTSGMNAEVDNHFFKMFSSSLIIGASTLLLPRADTTVTALPGSSAAGGVPTAGSIFASSVNNVVNTLLDRNKNIEPTLKLNAGDEFLFMATQDMVIPPYQ
jgi:type IV secretory pathway VirB10-like protein